MTETTARIPTGHDEIAAQ